VLAEVQEFLPPAEELIEARQGRDALAVLEAVTEEFLKGWEEIQDYDEEGECGTLFADLGLLWAEAILTADLAAGERKSWAKRLREWQAEVDDYLDGSGFAAAALAAEQGWDDPLLVRVLQGELTPKGAWEGDAPRGADELAGARLNILEREGRLQEYLYLAQAEGQTEREPSAAVVRLSATRRSVWRSGGAGMDWRVALLSACYTPGESSCQVGQLRGPSPRIRWLSSHSAIRLLSYRRICSACENGSQRNSVCSSDRSGVPVATSTPKAYSGMT
jgi:hypothetical protein